MNSATEKFTIVDCDAKKVAIALSSFKILRVDRNIHCFSYQIEKRE